LQSSRNKIKKLLIWINKNKDEIIITFNSDENSDHKTAGKIFPLVGRDVISKFLGWNEHRVRFSLQRLSAINEGKINKSQYENTGRSLSFFKSKT